MPTCAYATLYQVFKSLTKPGPSCCRWTRWRRLPHLLPLLWAPERTRIPAGRWPCSRTWWWLAETWSSTGWPGCPPVGTSRAGWLCLSPVALAGRGAGWRREEGPVVPIAAAGNVPELPLPTSTTTPFSAASPTCTYRWAPSPLPPLHHEFLPNPLSLSMSVRLVNNWLCCEVVLHICTITILHLQ
jgi:hypothetical protein